MDDFDKVKWIAAIGFGLFVFSLIDSMYHITTYGIVGREMLITNKLIFLAVPVLLLMCGVAKLMRPQESFESIFYKVFGPYLVWICLLASTYK